MITNDERIGRPEAPFLLMKESVMSGLFVALPCIVQSFNPEAVTIEAQPAIKWRINEDGIDKTVPLPLLVDVPVIFPRGGGATLTFPIKAGDECLVIFADRCIDYWWQSGGVQEAVDPRKHNLSDGFALVGPQSQAQKISGISTSEVQLRSDDGTVTAISQKAGAIIALPGEVNQIGTPTRGWQSVTNIATATPGRKVETDGDLRIRRSKSVALPSRTVLDGVIGSVSQIPGVARLTAFENDTSTTDGRGIPSHSIALIVDGGDSKTIAEVIALKKTPGTGTFGNIETIVTNHYGVTLPIRFSRPESVPIFVKITLEAFEGYTTLVGDKIKKAVSDYLNKLEIGTDIYRTKLFSPANLQSDPEGGTFYISKLEIGLSAGGVSENNITLKYHQFATCNTDEVEIVAT